MTRIVLVNIFIIDNWEREGVTEDYRLLAGKKQLTKTTITSCKAKFYEYGMGGLKKAVYQ